MTKNTDKAKGLWSLNPSERAEERKAQLRKMIVQVEDRPAVTLSVDEKLATGFDGRLQIAVQQHSPLPWSADKWATGYTVSATDHSVCHLQDCNNQEANAKLIVASVNHADKLAFALQQCAYAADTGKAIRQAREALAAYEAAQR